MRYVLEQKVCAHVKLRADLRGEGRGERGGVEDSENISHPKVRKNMLNKFYIMHRFETGLIISGKKKPNQIKSPPPPKKSQLVRPIVKLRNN